MYETPPPGHEDLARTSLRRRSPAPWIVLGVVLVAAIAGGIWYLRSEERPATPPAAQAPAPEATPTAEPPPAAPTPQAARELVEAISANPLFRRATAEDLPARAALVVSALANGESPRKPLAALGPARPFSVVTRGGTTSIDPASYHRYDGFADAVGSVDAAKLAAAYRALRGPLEAALRGLGYPEARLDDFTGRALRRVVAAPVRDGDVAVVGVRGFYAFADPKLEGLDDVQKHLVRMGPRNERIVQEKARELLRALGLGG